MSRPARGDRVAVVTGAARGIGAGVVAALVRDGLHVIAVDACEDEPGLGYPLADKEDLLAVERAGEGRVTAVVADVRDAEGMRDLAADASRRFGGIDVAVAAAGAIAGGRPQWETPSAELALMVDLNLTGVWNLAAAVVPAMLRRPEPRAGRFVALASAAGHRGLWHLAAYGAAKHAVVGLVRGLAADLRGTGVTAVAVSPGATRTPMLDATASLYGLADCAALGSHQVVDRLLEPEEVAESVRWLCSPAAAVVTGSVVHADGGFTT
jgi:SDR family mycofactocin-dependent oxidoreductase